jgi:WD40 repeat protein
VTLDDEKHN